MASESFEASNQASLHVDDYNLPSQLMTVPDPTALESEQDCERDSQGGTSGEEPPFD